MNASGVNPISGVLMPPVGCEMVGHFLAAVTKALCNRSDADLARMLDVPKTTLASWKSRGSIPDPYWKWFSSRLIEYIARRNADIPQVSTTARAAVIELIARANGDPLKIDRFRLTVTANSLGGLLALAEFFSELAGLEPWMLNSQDVESITDALEAAMPQFKQGINLVNELSPNLSQ